MVNDVSSFDHGRRRPFHPRVDQGHLQFDVCPLVDDKERVGLLERFIVDRDAVQVLTEHVAQRHVLVFEAALFGLERQLVQLHLVVSTPETVQLL